MKALLAFGWIVLGVLVAIPACGLTTSMSDRDVVCIVAAMWLSVALLIAGAYEMERSDR